MLLVIMKEGQTGEERGKQPRAGLLVAPPPCVPGSRPLVSSASPGLACSSPQRPGGTGRPPAYPPSRGASGPGWSSRSSATRTGEAGLDMSQRELISFCQGFIQL